MIELQDKTRKIKVLLENIYNNLNNIAEDSFEEAMARIDADFKIIEGIREELKQFYDDKTLKKLNNEFNKIIKQIKHLFDNKIEIIKNEQEKLKSEIQKLENQKKLSNYERL